MNENDGPEQAGKIQAAAGDPIAGESVAVPTLSLAEWWQTVGETPILAGHMISVPELEQAMREGRVLRIHYSSWMGDGSCSLYIASGIHYLSDGRVPEQYLVFPIAVPPELLDSLNHDRDWEESSAVFRHFGVEGECSLYRYERQAIEERARAEQKRVTQELAEQEMLLHSPQEDPLKQLERLREPLEARAHSDKDKELAATLTGVTKLLRSARRQSSTLRANTEGDGLSRNSCDAKAYEEAFDHISEATQHLLAATKALLK